VIHVICLRYAHLLFEFPSSAASAAAAAATIAAAIVGLCCCCCCCCLLLLLLLLMLLLLEQKYKHAQSACVLGVIHWAFCKCISVLIITYICFPHFSPVMQQRLVTCDPCDM
jgi:hypothetical protein